MNALVPWLFAASAGIVLMLGLVHLLYTFRGHKLHPRDAALQARMQEVSPLLTRETDMWRCWIGFNASHSLGAIFYGLVYSYLALSQQGVLLRSPFLLTTGFAALGGYVFLGKRYWFSVPYRCLLLAALLYVAALALALI